MDVDPEYRTQLADAGFVDPFADPRVRVWRSLPDRENATFDHVRPDGSTLRLHVKRYPAANPAAVAAEVRGHGLLRAAGIPTAPLVAHGSATDGRTFAAFADLTGYTPADKWLAEHPRDVDALLEPLADLAARLHAAGLHHRDLYLCHFMTRASPADVRVIDVARVARLTNPLTRRRWVVKDLGQFWFSTFDVAWTERQRRAWLARYADRRATATAALERPIRRKAAAIARHDANLNRRQPDRNVSIPRA